MASEDYVCDRDMTCEWENGCDVELCQYCCFGVQSDDEHIYCKYHAEAEWEARCYADE